MLVFPCQSGFRSHVKLLVLAIAIKIGSTRTRAKNPSNPIKNCNKYLLRSQAAKRFWKYAYSPAISILYITLLTKVTNVSPEELYAATGMAAIMLSYFFEIRQVKIRYFRKES